MGDDCGDCDCDCECDDCECDCGDCDCCDCLCNLCDCSSWDTCNCDCKWLGDCCLVQFYVCLFCFYAPTQDARTHHRSSSFADCSSCFCCDRRNDNIPASKTSTENFNDKRNKGFLFRLKSCLGEVWFPPSPPNRDQTTMENVTPHGYNQDGGYPVNDRERPKMEIVPPKAYNQDGRYPVNDGEEIQTVPPKVYKIDGRYPMNDPEHPTTENAPPKVYKQDGRYPMNNEGQFELTQTDYEGRPRLEELYMPPRKGIMDGNWSRPVKHGDQSGGHL